MKEKYGNYVIQFLIGLGDLDTNKQIVLALLDEFMVFSKLKYSSNVIEKVINKFYLLVVFWLLWWGNY